jgi:hypothetical protein
MLVTYYCLRGYSKFWLSSGIKMRSRICLWILPLFLVAVLFAQPVSAKVADPQLKILFPQEGQVITGSTVYVVYQVWDWNWSNPTFQGNHPNTGHMHMVLDGTLAMVVGGGTYAFTDVASGDHTLVVSLQNNDHSDYLVNGKPVSVTVQFKTTLNPDAQAIKFDLDTLKATPTTISMDVTQLVNLLYATIGLNIIILIVAIAAVARKSKQAKPT